MLLSTHSEPCLFGGLLDSVEMSISLPSDKLDAIIKTAREILKDGAVTYKVLSSFLSRLSRAAQPGQHHQLPESSCHRKASRN